jgi:hypothetical protein
MPKMTALKSLFASERRLMRDVSIVGKHKQRPLKRDEIWLNRHRALAL